MKLYYNETRHTLEIDESMQITTVDLPDNIKKNEVLHALVLPATAKILAAVLLATRHG